VGANDHRVLRAAFAVGGGPEPADDDVFEAAPDEDVLELLDLLVFAELVPGAGVDVAGDALDVEDALGIDELLGLEAEVINVVVPSGVLAESAQVELRRLGGLGPGKPLDCQGSGTAGGLCRIQL
jgi:hypothetical protein